MLDVVMQAQETKGRSQVISVKFSSNGEFLAVSYNNDPALLEIES
jgi:hypothetical protein